MAMNIVPATSGKTPNSAVLEERGPRRPKEKIRDRDLDEELNRLLKQDDDDADGREDRERRRRRKGAAPITRSERSPVRAALEQAFQSGSTHPDRQGAAIARCLLSIRVPSVTRLDFVAPSGEQA